MMYFVNKDILYSIRPQISFLIDVQVIWNEHHCAAERPQTNTLCRLSRTNKEHTKTEDNIERSERKQLCIVAALNSIQGTLKYTHGASMNARAFKYTSGV